MKVALFSLIFISLSVIAFAQNDGKQKLKKFDEKKYDNANESLLFDDLNSIYLPIDTLTTESSLESDMRVFAPQGNMSPMPTMEIRKDVKYSMQIKGFSNRYPYKPENSLDSPKIRVGKPLLLKDLEGN